MAENDKQNNAEVCRLDGGESCMKKVYLVWYRLQNDTEDRIRGAALNWHRAEKMAENLELMLNIANKTGYSFGVKSYEHGSLSCNLDEDGCFGRWEPDEFGEE